MPHIMVLYEIPSYVEPKWEDGLKAAGWKWVSRGAYVKPFNQSEQASQEIAAIFQTLDVELSDEDEEHVRLIFPGRDQQGNSQLGIKTLYGKKPL